MLRYVTPPVTVSSVERGRINVLSRASRWTTLRRLDLPVVFASESLYGLWSLLVVGGLTAWHAGWPVILTLLALTAYWHALEAVMVLGATGKWRLALHVHAALRDVFMPIWWFRSLIKPTFSWRNPSGMLAHDLKPDKPDHP